jgi:diacylglycerol O-acyltransferase
MIPMAGADAYFLREETPSRHMHTVKVIVVDPAGAHEKIDFARVREGALNATPYQLAFRRRAQRAPWNLARPLWLETLEFDPDYHVRHVELGAGADESALDDVIGRVASEPLDPQRPLWQISFVEGLPGGRIAYVTKIHHAVADGLASAELATRLCRSTPEHVPLPTRPPPLCEPAPSTARHLLLGLRRALARQRELPSLARRSLRALRAGIERRRRGDPMPPAPFSGPRTRFNQPLTPHRLYAHRSLPMAELRHVRAAFGCTLNDVYLTLVGGAVRHYLARRGELPAQPLTAAVPVSVRCAADDPAFGNATSYWFASTGSHLADPVERLRAVTASTRAARELFAARDARLPLDWLEHWGLRRLYLDGFQALGAALLRRPSYHVIASNVPGPRRPLFIDGARVVALHSMGPLTKQQGLNLTAWSYGEDLSVGAHACREHVPDLPVLLDSLAPELSLLLCAAQSR